MPVFECPGCGKRDLVPMGMCEWMLDSVESSFPDGDNTPVFWLRCADCRQIVIEVVEGDLLDQPVEVIVNAWNRNVIPWWLLLPQGVSRAIKRRGGYEPFREVARHGPIPLGGAVLTSAGRLPFRGIIHVAGINLFWRATAKSIRDSVRNALRLAHQHGFTSIAFPLIGAGTGSYSPDKVQELMLIELGLVDVPMTVKVVRYAPGRSPSHQPEA